MDESTTLEGGHAVAARVPDADEVLALVVAWSAEDVDRIGQVAFFEGDALQVLGRGSPQAGATERVQFFQQRPGVCEPSAPFESRFLSREQLRVQVVRAALEVERAGRCAMLKNGAAVERCTLRAGDTLSLKDQLVFLCVRRPRKLPPFRMFPMARLGHFAEPDAFGMLGESPAAHTLREAIAWNAKASAHVLVLGESGTGKELAARALHALSPRAAGALIARNATTIPVALADAELFGNARNYPNAGMAERRGLIGEADGGTLFLDEIGDLPEHVQTHLLRVLDVGGEYHRLGETLARRADLRVVAATNRAEAALKNDLAARLPLRLRLPSLRDRREDIPLLVRHLVRRAAHGSPELAARFVRRLADGTEAASVQPELVELLLRRQFLVNVREVEGLLWRAMSTSRGDVIELDSRSNDSAPNEPALKLDAEATAADAPRGPEKRANDPTAPEIREALGRHYHNVSRAAQDLGLSRYTLYRLMRRHGIVAEDQSSKPS